MFSKKKVENEGNTLLKTDSDQSPSEIDIREEAARGTRGQAMNMHPPKIIKPSIVSEGFEFIGDINKTNGPLNVDGTISGNITVDSISIGVNGVVSGVIVARSINVKGKLSGKIFCTEIVVGGLSTVEGELTYSSITIQRGGVFKGDLHNAKAGTAKHDDGLGEIDISQFLPNTGQAETDDVLPGAVTQQDGHGADAPDK